MIHVISQSTGQSVRRICQSLQVPRSSYYHAATPTESQRGDAELGAAISTIFGHHRRRYGYRRIWKQLAADGLVCAPDRVRRLMQEQGCAPSSPKPTCPKPAMVGQIYPRPICSSTSPCQLSPTRCGQETSPSFPAARSGSTSPSSSTSVLPTHRWLGTWPITCAAISSWQAMKQAIVLTTPHHRT